MTEKMITLTALEFTIEEKAVGYGVLIGEPTMAAGRTTKELLAAGMLQMGSLRREKGFALGKMQAEMEGVGRLDAVFTKERFILAKRLGVRENIWAPLRRLAVH